MVVDVSEVVLVLLRQSMKRLLVGMRKAVSPQRDAFGSVGGGIAALLDPEDLLQLLLANPEEDRVLRLVDAVVGVGEDREESCPRARRCSGRAAATDGRSPRRAPGSAADLGERGAVVPVNGEEEALGVEAVHLDQPVFVGGGAVGDDEVEVAWNPKTSRRVSKASVSGRSRSSQMKPPLASSSAADSRLKCISVLPRSWTTWQVVGPPRRAAESVPRAQAPLCRHRALASPQPSRGSCSRARVAPPAGSPGAQCRATSIGAGEVWSRDAA